MKVKGAYVVWRTFSKVLEECPTPSSYPESGDSPLL